MENNNQENKIIHTLSKDVSSAIESNKDGLIKKIIQNEEEKEEERNRQKIYNRKNKFYLFLTIFLVLTSLIILFFIFINNKTKIFEFNKSSLILFHEEYITLDIKDKNKDDFFSFISNEVINFKQDKNTIKGIYLLKDKEKVDFEGLLNLIDSRVFVKENIFKDYLIGIIKNTNEEEKEEVVEEIIEEEKEILDDFITLSTSAFFKTGTTEFIDIEAENRAKTLISYFLDTISLEDTKIKVVGTYSIERPWDKNEILAKNRKELGLKILNDVLKEKYKEEDISKIQIEASSLGLSLRDIYTNEEIAEMSEEEKNLKIDLNQGIQYLAESKKKVVEDVDLLNEEIGEITEEEKEIKEIISIYPKSNDLFILLKVNNIEDIFSIMKSWESDMFFDLHRFFGFSISEESKYLLERDFQDGIVQNKNARILYGDKGEIIFMYAFIDENFLIITRNSDTIKEVILRINSTKIKK